MERIIRLLLLLAVACAGQATVSIGMAKDRSDKGAYGRVIFPASAVVASNVAASDQQALIAAIKGSWDRYLHQDINGYSAFLSQDVTRMSQRFGQAQQGRSAVVAGLQAEWMAFERPGGVIAEDMSIDRAELMIDASGMAATAVYYVDVTGGARWTYTDQALVFQALTRENGRWVIAHQTDAWGLNEGASDKKRVFEFDYVYPVQNLARAVAFYRPILGEPESLTADRAVFNLTGPRFVLTADPLQGRGAVRPNLPSGYAEFLVPDVAAERDRLASADVTFLDNTAQTLKRRGQDLYAVGVDPSGNIFVLLQKNHLSAKVSAPPVITGFAGPSPYVQAVDRLTRAWMGLDADGVAGRYGTRGRWFDNTRVNSRGMEQGRSVIAEALRSIYWPRYDRSAHGLIGRFEASAVHVRALGKWTIVSFSGTHTGTGEHGFRDTSFVTHVFDGADSIANSFIINNNRPKAMVLDLDYTGYPVNNLSESENFYTNIMKLGKPYKDDNWKGYWSNYTVFGIYGASRKEDGIPIANKSNGYVSFWVRSAKETYDYLKKQGASFPVIPAINSEKGIESSPGYTQVTATDSEGNVVVFTEYSGRPR